MCLLSKHFTKPVLCYSAKTVSEEIQQVTGTRSTISCPVKKFELIHSVCNKKKCGVGRQWSAHMQDNVAYVPKKICDTMFPVTWYQKNINTHHHASGFDKQNTFPQHAKCGCSWSPCSLDMSPCNYFPWDYLKNHVYRTNPHNVQELQVEIEAAAE
jgi:hypothetical protein